MFPMLKVSPPIPVGRLPGRFKLQIWRASNDLLLKLPLGTWQTEGEVVAMSAAPHLGVAEGDEVLSINDVVIQDLAHAAELLEQSGPQMEINFYHKESGIMFEEETPLDAMCCSVMCSHRTLPIWCDFFYNPPEPRCRAKSWKLHDVLAASKVKELPGNIWQVRLQRFSMKQSFGLPLGSLLDQEASEMSNLTEEALLGSGGRVALPLCESFTSDQAHLLPSEEILEERTSTEMADGSPSSQGAVLLLRSVPVLGLLKGDELYRVNGSEITGVQSYKAATKNVMKVTLEFRRSPSTLTRREASASPKILHRLRAPERERRRYEDWHSVGSTKDCSHEGPEPWPIMLYKSSCRPIVTNSAETIEAADSSRSLTKMSEIQELIFL